MLRKNFVVFILSHGRSDKLITLKTIKEQGYTGDWFVIVDNEDSTIENYKRVCGEDHILVFDKLGVSKTFDTYDLSTNRKTIVYARNVCFDFAQQLGYDYFLELDDDYLEFEYREQEGEKLLTHHVRNIDDVFESMLQFLDDTQATSVAFAQGGDMIGGCQGAVWKAGYKRKAMNSFFCKTSNKFQFLGRINEDVNTYTTLGSRGALFLTIPLVDLRQVPTQNNDSGMVDVYKENGTYMKSFYTIMSMPSCVKISMMGEQHQRIHHSIDWDNCVPKIISSKFRRD